MTNDETNQLASQDAQSRASADMVQDDIWGTHLPNGMLLWFGFDFAWADLPSETHPAPGRPDKMGRNPARLHFQNRHIRREM